MPRQKKWGAATVRMGCSVVCVFFNSLAFRAPRPTVVEELFLAGQFLGARRRIPRPGRTEDQDSILREIPRDERPPVQSYPANASHSE